MVGIYVAQESFNKVLEFLLGIFRKYSDSHAFEEIMFGQDNVVEAQPKSNTDLVLDLTGEVQLKHNRVHTLSQPFNIREISAEDEINIAGIGPSKEEEDLIFK